MRSFALAAGLLLLLAAPADARLRSVAHLTATPRGTTVRLHWKDRARGETRYEVRRTGLRVRLKRNRTSYTDRKVTAGTTYRYRVRPCRRSRCAKARAIRLKVPTLTPPVPIPPPPAATGSPTVGACPIFPPDNPWNTDISTAPVDTSHDYIGSLGSMVLWPDFGGDGAYGIPYVSVPPTQPLVPVSFDVADESDPGPYPTPLDAPVEGGGDRHVLTLRQGDCKLFELYAAQRQGSGWHAYSGAVWDLHSNALRPEGWASADAAGLPILPGLARYGEVKRGHIDHALRFTADRTRQAFVFPARHFASDLTDPNLPAMGQRLRLKRGYDISRFPRQARIVLRALKRYGMILADNGSSWYVSGAPDPRWSNDQLHTLGGVPGSAFEVVRFPNR
jgi:hypothetical protein